MRSECRQQAAELKDLLIRHHVRLVLAESCTAGRVAATLGELPGISSLLCGSFVVYRADSKQRWLDLPSEILADPQRGPVSREATEWLALGALRKTPEAHLSLAVTGDVGPGAPEKSDGRCFCALAVRDAPLLHADWRLTAPVPVDANDITRRVARLDEATERVLHQAVQWIRPWSDDSLRTRP